jgi:hypothetical protein
MLWPPLSSLVFRIRVSHRERSNQSLEPTAGRRDAHIYFYETVLGVCHARSRRRWLSSFSLDGAPRHGFLARARSGVRRHLSRVDCLFPSRGTHPRRSALRRQRLALHERPEVSGAVRIFPSVTPRAWRQFEPSRSEERAPHATRSHVARRVRCHRHFRVWCCPCSCMVDHIRIPL